MDHCHTYPTYRPHCFNDMAFANLSRMLGSDELTDLQAGRKGYSDCS